MTRLLLIPAIALVLAGCSSLPAMPSLPDFGFGTSDAPAAAADVAAIDAPLAADAPAREQVNRAVHLLGAGRVEDARRHLEFALSKSPSDKAALGLMEQIDGDPAVLLGREHKVYTVVAGDTMSGLAAEHLGDPLKFFVLSRYNGLASPNALRVGATIKIPTGGVVKAAPAATPSMASAAPVVKTAAPPNAGRADALRLQGLEALNKGDVRRAVELLRNAEAMNASDPAIQRDLQRALRIQSSLGQ